MRAIYRYLQKWKKGEKPPSMSPDEYRDVFRELVAMGWQKNMDRPEDPPHWMYPHWVYRTGPVFPWWIDPEDGSEVRGLSRVLRIVCERHPEHPPSDHALQVLEALEAKPELLEEIRGLLEK